MFNKLYTSVVQKMPFALYNFLGARLSFDLPARRVPDKDVAKLRALHVKALIDDGRDPAEQTATLTMLDNFVSRKLPPR